MADIDEIATRAVAHPPARPRPLPEVAARAVRRRHRRRLGRAGGAAAIVAVLLAATVVNRTGGDGPERASDIAAGRDGGSVVDPDERVALDALLDRPAGPDDAFPDDFAAQWGWDRYEAGFPIHADLDLAASRSVSFAGEVPALAVPTEDRDGVCLAFTYPPPAWFPEVDSIIPMRCADAATFNRTGITLRECGPGDRWVSMALVPIGLDPDDVAPHGTLHPSGAAILLHGTGPDEPVELAYAPDRTVRLEGAPLGTQPGDGSVPCAG